VVLSQSDLQDKVSEVLEAVKKDQQATGSIQAVPKVVLVSHRPGLALEAQPRPNACSAIVSLSTHCMRHLRDYKWHNSMRAYLMLAGWWPL
jgi:hypothetical protein